MSAFRLNEGGAALVFSSSFAFALLFSVLTSVCDLPSRDQVDVRDKLQSQQCFDCI